MRKRALILLPLLLIAQAGVVRLQAQSTTAPAAGFSGLDVTILLDQSDSMWKSPRNDRYAHRIATILSHLHATRAVICTFGNHDYSMFGKSNFAEGTRRGNYLEQCLEERGLICLRNETWTLAGSGAAQPLTLVGLDDEWSGHIDPDRAWAGVDPSHAIVCLNHNPVNTIELMRYPWHWMLAGHTHGRQVATSRFGRKFYPHRYRHFTHGYYQVNGRHLYVNRGLSYGQRGLHWCRPEITVFRLETA